MNLGGLISRNDDTAAAALMVTAMESLALSPAGPERCDFALSSYLEAMRPYTAALMVWDEDKQTSGFAAQWRAESASIITVGGRVVGWLQVAETDEEIWLQQLFVAPQDQGRGIGTEVLQRLLGQWRLTGKPVVLTVLKNNPARALYERLGFSVVAEQGVKFEMRLVP